MAFQKDRFYDLYYSIFSFFIFYLFLIIEDTYNSSEVDDNTLYVSADKIHGVVKSSEEASEILFKWFNDNLMKINIGKCHLLVSIKNTLKKKKKKREILT